MSKVRLGIMGFGEIGRHIYRLCMEDDMFEVVAISDHGKPMKLTSATGKVTVFNGNDKTEAPLALAGDKLEAKGSFKVGAGTKVLADVALNGKPAVAASSHSRYAIPGACRAARPLRWVADARLTRSVTSRVIPAARS